MAVHLSGAYLLGYSQTNNFFGDTLFRLGSTATMKVSAIIDVRPGGSDGYPGDPNTDHLGAKEAFDIINSQANNIENWQEIEIDYGLGNTVIATGRVVSMESTRQNPVRIGEYNVTLEMPISGGQEAFNMQGPGYQQPSNFQNGFAGNTVGEIFQESGAAFENFSEQFAFSISDESSYEYEHSLNIQMISGQHICPDPIQTSKEVAQAIFNVAPSDAPAFGFIDEQFSGFYALTNIQQDSDISGVKYFSEAYDLLNLNCSFAKRCVLDGQLKDDYSLTLNHSMTLDENGIVNVTENGSLKSTRNRSPADLDWEEEGNRFAAVRGFMETEIAGAKTRCDSFYGNYLQGGYVDPDYQGNRDGEASNNAEGLVNKPIKIGRSYQPNLATAQYSVNFVNHRGKYTTDFIHEYTQTVNENEDGVVNVTENGKIVPYLAAGDSGESLKNTSFYDRAVLDYSSAFKNTVKARADATHGWYRGKEAETFQELINEHYPREKTTYADLSLMPISKQVTLPRYGIGLEYSHVYSDDPSLLKSTEKLYEAGFRKFSISTNDTFMTPTNSTFTIPGLKRLKADGGGVFGRQVIHDGTQTKMGNRNFSINGFLARPNSSSGNVLSKPSVWDFSDDLNKDSNKLNMIKDVITFKMNSIVSDVALGAKHDIFVKDVSFSINSKGEFSAQGNIPFVQLGGVEHDTLGKLVK